MKNLIIVLSLAFCLTSYVFMIRPTASMPDTPVYNPLADINNDGEVDIYDAIILAGAYGSHGTPVGRTFVAYDSGWMNITNMTGQDIVINHDLNRTDLTLDITTKATSDGPEQKCYGLKTIMGWNHTYGGPANEEIHSAIRTSDGGFALAGDTNALGYQGYLVKTDSAGNMQWSRTYGVVGFFSRFYADVIQTTDGGYALAGCTSYNSTGDLDFWLVKTDANGTELWNRNYGGTGEDIAFALTQTSDGGYILGGRTKSFGPDYDFYVVKTNSTGDVEWAQHYGGPNDDAMWTSSNILEGSDGGYMFAGETKSFGAGNGDIWLIKTDSLGNVVWNQTYGGPHEDGGGDLIKTSDGGYLIAGNTASWGAGGQDVWLVKIDQLGNVQWNKTYGGAGDDIATCVIQSADGGYAVGAVTKSFGLGGWDAWFMNTDANGTTQWNRVYGGTGDDEFYSIIQAGDAFVLAGDTASFGAGGPDAWLVQTDLQYGLVWKDTTSNSITFFRPLGEIQCNYVRIRLLEIPS